MKLTRDDQSATRTLGRIDFEGGRPIYTLERPWIAASLFAADDRIPCGRKGVSCVPPGPYQLVPHNSEAHPHTVALVNPDLWVYHFDEDVPADRRGFARTTVLIHPANYVSELRGCIAPGWLRAGDTIQQSRRAFDQLSTAWPSTLEIVEAFGARV
jgi:hypothetical protein